MINSDSSDTYRMHLSIFESLFQQLSFQLTLLVLRIVHWIYAPTVIGHNIQNLLTHSPLEVKYGLEYDVWSILFLKVWAATQTRITIALQTGSGNPTVEQISVNWQQQERISPFPYDIDRKFWITVEQNNTATYNHVLNIIIHYHMIDEYQPWHIACGRAVIT